MFLLYTNFIDSFFPSLQPIESLQADAVMLSHLRSAELKIHEALFDLGKRPNQYYCNFPISYGGSRIRKVCHLLPIAGVLMQRRLPLQTNQYYRDFSLSYGGERTQKISRLLKMDGVPMQKLFG